MKHLSKQWVYAEVSASKVILTVFGVHTVNSESIDAFSRDESSLQPEQSLTGYVGSFYGEIHWFLSGIFSSFTISAYWANFVKFYYLGEAKNLNNELPEIYAWETYLNYNNSRRQTSVPFKKLRFLIHDQSTLSCNWSNVHNWLCCIVYIEAKKFWNG